MVIVPTIIETKTNSEHVYDLYSCLLKERIILLNGEINDALSSSICAQLLYLSSLSKQPIIIYINSQGGSVSAGLAIYDIIRYLPCPVHTIGMGMCASMAAILLCAGTKRYALKNCSIMIHQPLGGIQGQAKDMEIAAKHIIKTKQVLYQILAKHSHKTIEEIADDCDRDYYMNTQEALAYGFIDEIIQETNKEEPISN